jgi:hypothetical protein
MKYQQTKKECESKIHGVCEGCGGKLVAIKTVNNSRNPTYWSGCRSCSCFRSGVPKIYFDVARECVEKNIITPYHHLVVDKNNGEFKTPEQVEYYYQSQTAALSLIILQIHRMIVAHP